MSVPTTVVVEAPYVTELRIGKFWNPFGPESASAASLKVTPGELSKMRSMPSPLVGVLPGLSKIEFPRMVIPVGDVLPE